MALDQTDNFVRGTVSASIASGDTTISVTDASIYPDPANGEYNLVLWDTDQGRPDQDASVEVVRVTGRDTTNDNLTVTRGQEGTSAVSHPATSALLLDATDKQFTDVDSVLESVASISGTPPTADHLTSQLGTSSNRQDVFATEVDGQTVDLTDPNVIYASQNGSKWIAPYKISDYADAGAALQAAYDDLDNGTENIGQIDLPPGTLSFDTQPQLVDGKIDFRGRGIRHTTLENPRTDGTRLMLIDGLVNSHFADFAITGSGSSSTGDRGIECQGTNRSTWMTEFERVYFTGTGDHACYLNTDCFNVHFNTCFGGGTSGGANLYTTGADQVQIQGGYWNNGATNNIHINSGAGARIATTVGKVDSGASLLIDGPHSAPKIDYIWAETQSARDGVKIQAGDAQISHAYLNNNGSFGMNFTYSSNINISHIRSNSNDTGLQFFQCTDVSVQNSRIEDGYNINQTKDVTWEIVDRFRGVSDGDSDNTISLTFEAAYQNQPVINFGRRGGGIDGISFTTDGNGNYDGVDVSIATAGGTIDANVTPN